MASLDLPAVRAGGLVGVGTIVPIAVLASVIVDEPGAVAVLGFLVVITVGFVAAGLIAGGRRSDTPIAHGAAAAIAAAVVSLVIGIVWSLLRSDATRPSVVSIVLILLVAACCGVGGGLTADWLRRRSNRA